MGSNIDSIWNGMREIKPQSPDEVIFEPKVSSLTEAEKAKLAEMARGLSEDEIMVILENISAELCMKRIELELKKARAFSNAVKNTLNIVE